MREPANLQSLGRESLQNAGFVPSYSAQNEIAKPFLKLARCSADSIRGGLCHRGSVLGARVELVHNVENSIPTPASITLSVFLRPA